jgi:hypothetical protein
VSTIKSFGLFVILYLSENGEFWVEYFYTWNNAKLGELLLKSLKQFVVLLMEMLIVLLLERDKLSARLKY